MAALSKPFWRVPLISAVVLIALAAFHLAPLAAAECAADHVLVKFRPEIKERLKAVAGQAVLNRLVSELGLPAGVSLAEPQVSQLLRSGLDAAQEDGSPDLSRFLYLYLPPGFAVEACLAKLAHHSAIDYAEPDGIGRGGRLPSDPDFGAQWHHRNSAKPSACIHTPQAWDIAEGSEGVLTAVLDTGVNSQLVEFTNRIVAGYNFAYGDTNTADDFGHGTVVAATLGANANNGHFGAGVDWRCRIMPIKVLDSSNYGLYSWWAQGVDYAVSRGCKVINLSAGGATASTTLERSIDNAIARGVIFVTITQNNGTNVIAFPGSYTRSITVGATDERDVRTSFSNYGPEISLVAPGIDIHNIGKSGGFETWEGTSFAAPMVAGVCSMMAGLLPGLDQTTAYSLVCLGADDRVGDATDTPGFDHYYGWGRLNAYNSLLLATTRIDRVGLTNGVPMLSWASPANAGDKQPYLVELADSPSGPWSTVTDSTAFQYSTNRTYWVDPFAVPNGPSRFYRIVILSLGTK
jgi:hypothetical protein